MIVPRSFIGELLATGLDGLVDETVPVRHVLDLCTGSGCLAILAALAFPDATVDAVDISGGCAGGGRPQCRGLWARAIA